MGVADIAAVLFWPSFRPGNSVRLCWVRTADALHQPIYSVRRNPSRGQRIRVRRVVVVDVTRRVDIPRIVRVPSIGRTEAHVLCTTYIPVVGFRRSRSDLYQLRICFRNPTYWSVKYLYLFELMWKSGFAILINSNIVVHWSPASASRLNRFS